MLKMSAQHNPSPLKSN